MAISYLSSNGRFCFPRYVPLGFSFIGDMDLRFVSSSLLRMTWNPNPNLIFDWHLREGLFTNNTNMYTLDHCFDWNASQCFLSGVPVASGFFVRWEYVGLEVSPRIIIDGGFPPFGVHFIDFPPVTSPWYVRP